MSAQVNARQDHHKPVSWFAVLRSLSVPWQFAKPLLAESHQPRIKPKILHWVQIPGPIQTGLCSLSLGSASRACRSCSRHLSYLRSSRGFRLLFSGTGKSWEPDQSRQSGREPTASSRSYCLWKQRQGSRQEDTVRGVRLAKFCSTFPHIVCPHTYCLFFPARYGTRYAKQLEAARMIAPLSAKTPSGTKLPGSTLQPSTT